VADPRTIDVGILRYVQNFSWVLLEKICRLFISFLVTAWVIRYLGPEQYGLLSFAISFTSFFVVFVTLGLDSLIVRDLVRNPESESVILGTAFRLRFYGSVAGFTVITVLIFLMGYDALTRTLIMFVASGMIMQAPGILEPFFQSRVEARYITLSNIWTMVATSLLRVVLIVCNAGVAAFALVFTVDKALLGGMLYAYYRRAARKPCTWQFSRPMARRLLRNGMPLIFAGLVVMLYMRIDQVMIREMLGNEALGYYSAAVYLAEGWYFIGMAASSSLFPAIVSAKAQGIAVYHDRLQSYYRVMVWLALSVAVPVHFLADPLIAVIYGTAYQQSADVLRVNVWTGVFVFLGVASSAWLVTENLQRISLIRTSAGAVLNIILNLMWIPKYGIVGSAWATLISQAVSSYLAYACSKITFRTFIMQTKAFYPPFREIQALISPLSRI
jgi:O-antigen/teichoic acid export membrane protein